MDGVEAGALTLITVWHTSIKPASDGLLALKMIV